MEALPEFSLPVKPCLEKGEKELIKRPVFVLTVSL